MGLFFGRVAEMTTRMRNRSSRKRSLLPPPVLADIVRRVAEVAKPQRIVMFGSAARGTMRPDSDVDLLVVKSGRFHRGRPLLLLGPAGPVEDQPGGLQPDLHIGNSVSDRLEFSDGLLELSALLGV